MAEVVDKEEGGGTAESGRVLERQVDASEGNWRESLSMRVLEKRTGHHDDGAPHHVTQNEDVKLVQTLVCQVGVWWWCSVVVAFCGGGVLWWLWCSVVHRDGGSGVL